MEIIKSIETIRSRIKIRFESGWEVWLNKNCVPPFPLLEGFSVNRESFLKFILLHQYPSALNTAVAMLARRSCSQKEITNRLHFHHYDEEVISLVICKLNKEKLLNDEDFTSQWVQSRMKKYGASRIKQELRLKGIDTETASAALEELYSEDEQFENAVAFAKRKIKSIPAEKGRGNIFQTVTGMLIRKGFSWDIAKKAVNHVLSLSDPEQ